MAALPGIINIVIISVLIMKGNTKSDEYSTVNLTVGRPGSLRCSHPISLKDKVIAYWQNESQTICYYKTNTTERCDGFQHHVAEGEIILTIPKVKISHSGKYNCFVYTEYTSFECRINLQVISESRVVNPRSNGIHIKAGCHLSCLPPPQCCCCRCRCSRHRGPRRPHHWCCRRSWDCPDLNFLPPLLIAGLIFLLPLAVVIRNFSFL